MNVRTLLALCLASVASAQMMMSDPPSDAPSDAPSDVPSMMPSMLPTVVGDRGPTDSGATAATAASVAAALTLFAL